MEKDRFNQCHHVSTGVVTCTYDGHVYGLWRWWEEWRIIRNRGTQGRKISTGLNLPSRNNKKQKNSFSKENSVYSKSYSGTFINLHQSTKGRILINHSNMMLTAYGLLPCSHTFFSTVYHRHETLWSLTITVPKYFSPQSISAWIIVHWHK